MDNFLDWALVLGFLGQFAAIVWWAAQQTSSLRAVVQQFSDLSQALKDHVESTHETHLELYRAIERLATIQETSLTSKQSRPRPRAVEN